MRSTTAEQLVQGHAGRFGLDVPECHIDGGDGGHADRAPAPVDATIKELPYILDLVRISPDQAGYKMFLQQGGDRQFAAIESGIANAIEPVFRLDFKGDKVTARAGDNDAGVADFQHIFLFPVHAPGLDGQNYCLKYFA